MAGLPDINLSNRRNPTLSGIRDYVSNLAGPEGIYTQLMRNTRILGDQIDSPVIQGVLFGICDRIQVMLDNCNRKMQAVQAFGYFNGTTVVTELFGLMASTLEELDIVYLQNFLDMHTNGIMTAQELNDAREIMRSLFRVQEGIAPYFSTVGYLITMPTIPRPNHPASCQIILEDGRKLPDLNQEFEAIFSELQGKYVPERRTILADSEAIRYFMRNCKALIQATATELQAFNVDYFALKVLQPVVHGVVGYVVSNMQERVALLPKLDEVPPQPIVRALSRAGLRASELSHNGRASSPPVRPTSRLTFREDLRMPVAQHGHSPHLEVHMPPVAIQFDTPPGSFIAVTSDVSVEDSELGDVNVREFQATVRVRVETPKPRPNDTK